MNRQQLHAILLGGFLAGTIDIGAATLVSRRHDSIYILHAIAAGLVGPESSFNGGLMTALLGLFLQWAMSIAIAAIFVGAAIYIPSLKRLWLIAGLSYGVAIFVVMNYVVVPLSALHVFPQFTLLSFSLNMLAMLVFGTIVAWFAREEPSGSA
jgi:hypothetical protein